MMKRISKIIVLFAVVLSFQACSSSNKSQQTSKIIKKQDPFISYMVPLEILEPVEIWEGIKIFHQDWQFFELERNGLMGIFSLFRTEDIMDDNKYQIAVFGNLWRNDSPYEITAKDAEEYPYARAMVYCSSLNPAFCRTAAEIYLKTFERMENVKYFKHQFFSNTRATEYYDVYWFGLKHKNSVITSFMRNPNGTYNYMERNE